MVGLRPHIDNIPEDTFQQEGSLVYRISLSQIFSRGELSRQQQGNLFFGGFDAQALSAFVEKIQQLAFSKGVLSTQVVGRGGLAMALLKMSGKNLGFLSSKNFVYEDLTQEVLYQTLWEVSEARKDFFEAQARQLGLKLEKIGSVQRGFFQLEPWITMNVQDLATWMEEGLRRNIESLA
jgi:phosphoribosylformylglycinamidine (FGAM) synthase-like enzyme